MPVGKIIGCVDLVEIMTAADFGILAETKLGAKKLEFEQYRRLHPSQKAGFLEKWRHVHELVSEMPELARELHGTGPFCWLLRNPRRLREPVVMQGKLNLWKAEFPVGLALA
jgi:hypothetical protein